MPWAVMFLLKWIRDKMSTGRRMETVEVEGQERKRKRKIWTDAKATEERAWIGGWLDNGGGTENAEWFSMEVDEVLAPWLKTRGGSPKRMIAALEFLGTIVALKLWMDEEDECTMATEAFTDNRGNDFILKKGLSTKFPITLMVIEVSEMLREKRGYASLRWVKRDENQEADDLTNEVFTKFKMENRREVKSSEVKWIVMDKLVKESALLYDKITKLKDKQKKDRVEPTRKRSQMGKKKDKVFGRWSS